MYESVSKVLAKYFRTQLILQLEDSQNKISLLIGDVLKSPHISCSPEDEKMTLQCVKSFLSSYFSIYLHIEMIQAVLFEIWKLTKRRSNNNNIGDNYFIFTLPVVASDHYICFTAPLSKINC